MYCQSDSVVGGTLCEWMQQSGTFMKYIYFVSNLTEKTPILIIVRCWISGPTVSLYLIRMFSFGNMNRFRERAWMFGLDLENFEEVCQIVHRWQRWVDVLPSGKGFDCILFTSYFMPVKNSHILSSSFKRALKCSRSGSAGSEFVSTLSC